MKLKTVLALAVIGFYSGLISSLTCEVISLKRQVALLHGRIEIVNNNRIESSLELSKSIVSLSEQALILSKSIDKIAEGELKLAIATRNNTNSIDSHTRSIIALAGVKAKP